jgi:hypothetical protein
MAEGDIVLYNNFKEGILTGLFNLATDTIRITLHTGYTPNIDTHDQWADTGVSSTEYGTGAGYTAGGATLGSLSVTQDDTNDRVLWDAADVTWSSLGALTPATPSHAIIWDDTTTGDLLICYIVLGTTATNGGNYTIAFSSSPAAIISIT